MASYIVGDGGREERAASLTSDYPVLASRPQDNDNKPEFSPATVTREVSEGKKGMTVGAPVRATDDISNALNYTWLAGDATGDGDHGQVQDRPEDRPDNDQYGPGLRFGRERTR